MDGTAEANSAYIPHKSDIVFKPGETHKSIDIALVTDNEWELDETFIVRMALDASQAAQVKLGPKSVVEVIIIIGDGELEEEFLISQNEMKNRANLILL